VDRRRFLKYAGATAAVVGASALGLGYLSPQSPSIVGSTASATATTKLTTASSDTSSQLASLRGRLFFDHNGNGVQDGEEPSVPGALVQLKDYVYGKVVAETLTDSSGDYRLEDVRMGDYNLHISTEHLSHQGFRYMCRSPDEFRPVTEDYNAQLHGSVTMDVGLMEGFLTLPVSPETEYRIGRFYDWDPDPKKSLWWNGRTGNEPWNHSGIDYDTREGEDVVAPAPGKLYPIERGPQGQLSLGLHHPDAELSTCYNHLSKVLNKVYVARGEKIAETGSTGASYPHLHFNTAKKISNYDAFLDPYRPLFALNKKNNGYWARHQGNDVWQAVVSDTNPNLDNFWTKDNDPQYSLQ